MACLSMPPHRDRIPKVEASATCLRRVCFVFASCVHRAETAFACRECNGNPIIPATAYSTVLQVPAPHPTARGGITATAVSRHRQQPTIETWKTTLLPITQHIIYIPPTSRDTAGQKQSISSPHTHRQKEKKRAERKKVRHTAFYLSTNYEQLEIFFEKKVCRLKKK